MRYFKARTEAGKILAKKLSKYKDEKCVIVSLSEGGVVVGLEIAKALSCEIYLLVSEEVDLPGERDPIGAMSSAGIFTYNKNDYPAGELEHITAEYRSVVEQNRLQVFHKLNNISTKDSSNIPKKHLKNHTVILLSDGLKNGLSLDVASDFLKPIKIKKLIIASPIVSVDVVDKLHLMADKIVCLGVVEEYLGTDHYYENNELPKHDDIILTMQSVASQA